MDFLVSAWCVTLWGASVISSYISLVNITISILNLNQSPQLDHWMRVHEAWKPALASVWCTNDQTVLRVLYCTHWWFSYLGEILSKLHNLNKLHRLNTIRLGNLNIEMIFNLANTCCTPASNYLNLRNEFGFIEIIPQEALLNHIAH
jgi:hypothetical protein